MAIMRARYVRQVGVRGKLRIYWDEVVCKEMRPCEDHPGGHPTNEYLNTCPNSYGRPGSAGLHNAYAVIGDRLGSTDFNGFGTVEMYPPEGWPVECADCRAPVPEPSEPRAAGERGIYLVKQVSVMRLYDSPSGNTEPGDVYWMDYHHPGECPFWDNCDGVHLWAVLPNGHTWDIDGRANNCSMPEEKTHRCWIRTGSPEAGTLHVDKNGHTCAAGAGSIAVPGYHGFLHGFTWTGC